MAEAKTIYVDAAASGGNNGKNWNNAYTSLQTALGQSLSGDEIWVAAGVYLPGTKTTDFFRARPNVSMFGGFKGGETNRNQRNPLINKTILSGEIGSSANTDNINKILVIGQTVSAPIAISGFTISDGYAESFIASGVEVASSSPVFSWCTFENNTNVGGFSSGAAVTISNFDAEAKPQFINCIFRNNECSVIGGAVHNSGDVSVFVNCLFDGNKATRGGALHNGDGVIATFNCTFVNNTADKGSTSYATGGTATQHINAIIWDNNSSPVMNISSSVSTTVKYSIIRGGYTGDGNINKDPKFISTTDFGLSSASPARDVGDPDVDPADLPSQDLAGGNRLTFSKLDLGAYEYQCQVSGGEITVSTCDEYISDNGITYNKSGQYTEKFATKDGCDSVITLNLTITKAEHTISETVCESIKINDKTYTQSGTYYQTLKTSKGCDSLLTLELTVNQVNVDVSQSGNTLTSDANGATYQWLDCDNNNAPIDGATDKSFTATKDGNYAVEVTKNGCTTTSDCFELTPSSLGDILISSELKLYPNPVIDELTIELMAFENLTYEVYNIQGSLMNQGMFKNGLTKLPISNYPGGIYFVKTELGTFKFNKQ